MKASGGPAFQNDRRPVLPRSGTALLLQLAACAKTPTPSRPRLDLAYRGEHLRLQINWQA